MEIKVIKKGNISSYFLRLIPNGGWYKIGYYQYLMHKKQII